MSHRKESLSPLLIGVSLITLLLAALSTQAAMPLGATISVTNSSGGTGGPGCTLRDAITTANTAANTGGCVLIGGGSPVTITLDAAGPYIFSVVDNVTDAANALPAITGPLVIQGNGRTLLRNSAGGTPSFRFFYVSAGADVTLKELVIRNGRNLSTDGAGVHNEGILKVMNSTIDANAAGDGGGIANFGTLTVTNSTVSNNEGWNCLGIDPRTAKAGKNNHTSSWDYGNTGGITNFGLLTVVGSTLSNNYSICWGGGIYNSGGVVTIIDSLLKENIADVDEGGGIYNESGSITIVNSTFISNTAYGGEGGGIINFGNGTLQVSGSAFISNTSDSYGGGVANHGTLTVTDTTFRGNRAGLGGGGIYNSSGSAMITGSTLTGNRVSSEYYSWGRGGGILAGGMMTIANSTISGNWVDELMEGMGGGVSSGGTLLLLNSTLSGNWADDGGGGLQNMGAVYLNNTIIANSPAGGDCLNTGSIGTNIASLIEDGSCTAPFSGDPLLGPLQDNGGPTWTQALLESSPALDMGDAAVCAMPPVNGLDQRGITRPQGSGCDIGAFERAVEIEPITGLAAANDSPTLLGAATTLTATVTGGTEISYAWNFGDGTLGAGAIVTHTYTAVGLYTAVVTATNSVSTMTTATAVTIYQLPTPGWRLYLPVMRRP